MFRSWLLLDLTTHAFLALGRLRMLQWIYLKADAVGIFENKIYNIHLNSPNWEMVAVNG